MGLIRDFLLEHACGYHNLMNNSEFFATCAKGLEQSLHDELRVLADELVDVPDNISNKAGDIEIIQQTGGVAFSAPLALAYKACMWSRVASRILLKIHSFSINDDQDLYREVMSVDWSEHLTAFDSLAIDCFSSHKQVNNSHFATLRIKDAIVDQFSEKTGHRPDIDKEAPAIRVNAYLSDRECMLYIDLSGDALHKRGYRHAAGGAPIRETLAAGLLYRAGWPALADTGAAFYDPMCGSGTLLVEAAMMASDMAPGLLREYFSLEGWKQHDENLWQEIREQAEARASSGRLRCPPITGSDIDQKVIGVARKNIEAAGMQDVIKVYLQDATEPPGKSIRNRLAGSNEETPGLVLVNPPYGKRLGDEQMLRSTYMRFGKQLRKAFPGWVVAVITAQDELARSIGLRAFKKNSFYNGPIKSILYQYRIAQAKTAQAKTAQGHLQDPGQDSGQDPGQEHEHSDSARAETQALSPAQSQHVDMFRNRLQKNYRHLKKWSRKNDIECYRVYDADIPQYAVAIDLYGDWVHVQEYKAPKTVNKNRAFQRVNDVLDVVADVLETTQDKVVLKVRQKQSGSAQYEKLSEENRRMSVHEGGLEFLVNLRDYLDTGLFLDHRNTRTLVRSLAANTRFLNLFAYTGSVSVYAASGGAVSTTTVDMSNTYINWAKHNMLCNGFKGPEHAYVKQDCMKWIAEAVAASQSYDLIFVDPPTFSNSKSMDTTLDIIRDHEALLSGCLALLSEQGRLVFSTNARGFKMSPEMTEACYLKEITGITTTEDFRRKPVHRSWILAKKEELVKVQAGF